MAAIPLSRLCGELESKARLNVPANQLEGLSKKIQAEFERAKKAIERENQ